MVPATSLGVVIWAEHGADLVIIGCNRGVGFRFIVISESIVAGKQPQSYRRLHRHPRA